MGSDEKKDSKNLMNYAVPAFGKGCLLGLGIAALFVIVGFICYWIASLFDLPQNIQQLIAIAGGPTLGTIVTMVLLYRRSRLGKLGSDPEDDDETADRD